MAPTPLTVANVESIFGCRGDDKFTLSVDMSGVSIDLGSGNDTLTLGAFANTLTVANVETLVGVAGNDTVTLATALGTQSIDLGGGANTLTLADLTNTGTVSNIETLIGGSGADSITLATVFSHGSVDLGVEADILTLGGFNNSGTIANASRNPGRGIDGRYDPAGQRLDHGAMAIDLGGGRRPADPRRLRQHWDGDQCRNPDRRLRRGYDHPGRRHGRWVD